MLEEGLVVQAVCAGIQQHIHALEGRLAQLQAVVNLVLEGAQVHCADEADIDHRLLEQLRQHRRQLAGHQGGLAVRRAAQHLHGRLAHAPAHAQIGSAQHAVCTRPQTSRLESTLRILAI